MGGASMNNYIFFWLIVALFFLLFELGSPGLFYFLSFSFGALITSFASALCITMFDQAIIFIVSSIAAFFVLNKWVRKQSGNKHHHSNVYAMQGKKGVVVTPATLNRFGYVHIGGQVWAYKTMHDEIIAVGCPVEVIDVRGAHVIVRSFDLNK